MFLSSEQRLALNKVEPFDEWEEFALFASHYFLLVAIKSQKGPLYSSQEYISRAKQVPNQGFANLAQQLPGGPMLFDLDFEALPKAMGQRRFGSTYQISSGLIGHHGGLGTQSRLASSDFYKLERYVGAEEPLPPQSIEARMCHTITHLFENDCLLVGGRTSPDRPLADCWLRNGGAWKRAQDLPKPLYRHCATSVELSIDESGVLIYGGKSDSGKISGDWFLWRGYDTWEKVEVYGTTIKPRFGAVMASTEMQRGILLGGMAEDGIICDEMLEWRISGIESRFHMEVKKVELSVPDLMGLSNAINRLGACLTNSIAGFLLTGGISRWLLPQKLDAICLRPFPSSSGDRNYTIVPSIVEYEVCGSRPLLIGHSAYNGGDSVALAGGGAVCFSFGTYWNHCIYSIQMGGRRAESIWSHVEARKLSPESNRPKEKNDASPGLSMSWGVTETAKSVTPRMRLEDSRDFERVVRISNPVVMEGMDLGPCITEWSLEALKVKVGANRPVSAQSHTLQSLSDTHRLWYMKLLIST